jgi:subtilase family serine protease
MSQRKGAPASEAAAALELLTLRDEINTLALREARLKLQVLELENQIASYETASSRLEGAREAGNAPLAADQAQDRALQAQLADAREHLAQVSAEKDRLTAKQQAAQKRLKRLRARLQRDARRRQADQPWAQGNPAPRQGSQKSLIVMLSGLLLIALVSVLIHFAGSSSLSLSQLSNASSGSSPNGDTPEDPPFFTPAKTAPTNQGCVTTLKYACYSPEYIQQALGLTSLYKSGYDGSGQTIVLIGAGDAPTLQTDLPKFDLAWGLPNPKSVSILYPDGLPDSAACPNSASLQEINTADVEWAHAIAPGASIVLILGANKPDASQPQGACVQPTLQQDISYALNHVSGNVIAINYGSSELDHIPNPADPKSAMQKYFTDGHALLQQATAAHISVVAAAGDNGATNPGVSVKSTPYWTMPNVAWPASDPDALAVGGTVLTLDNGYYDDAYVGETAWNSATGGATSGGLSAVFAEPDYQKLVPDQALFQGKRAVPDVTFPAANLLAYNSTETGNLVKANPQWTHWDVAEGTGLAAAAWAGLIAIANQMHGQPLGLIQPALYSLGGKGMHDITSGSNTYANVQGYQAQPGYDLVTGWGTPIARDVLPALARATDHPTSGCDPDPGSCP